MSREKQIEEMAVKLGIPACEKVPCRNCGVTNGCDWREYAIVLYNAGYRKASDVAREIFADIETCMKNFEDDDDGYLLKKCEFEYFMRELKKEYTEV